MSEPMARVLTLGPLEASRTEEQVQSGLSGRRKPFCLMVYLLVARSAGDFHQRSTLSALFWPESDERHARASLRQAFRTIEQELGPVLEKRGRGEVRVRPQAVWVDLPRFRAAVEEERWAHAVSLYRGPFLDGVHLPGTSTFERWVDRLQLECTAAYRLALRRLASGEVPGIEGLTRSRLWQELSALAPYDAATALSLARALDDVGHPREARTALEHYLDRLAAETTAPPPDTVRREIHRLPETPPAPSPLRQTPPDVERSEPGEVPTPTGRATAVDPRPFRPAGAFRPARVRETAPSGGGPASPRPSGRMSRARGWPRPLVSGGLATAVVVAFLVSGPPPPPSGVGVEAPLRVAVPPLHSGDDPILGTALSLIVGEELSRLENVEVVPYHVLNRALRSARPDTALVWSVDRFTDAAVGLGADLLVVGSLFPPTEGGPELVLDLVETASGEAVGSSILSLPGAEDPIRDAAARASTRIADAFARPFAARGEHARAQTPPALEAYLAFVEALAAFAAFDYPAAEAHARRALELDPAFAPARIELATQLGNQGDFKGAAAHVAEVRQSGTLLTTTDRERLDWLEAVLEADRPRRLEVVETGGAWWTPHQRAYELAGLGRAGSAIEVLRSAEEEDRFPEFRERETVLWAACLHALGDHRGELRLVRRRAADLKRLAERSEIRALAAAGHVEEAEAVVAAAGVPNPATAALAYELGLELLAHGQEDLGLHWLSWAADALPEGMAAGTPPQRLRSDALFAAGRWSEARGAMEARAAADPSDVNARGALAVIDARTGQPKRARKAGESLADGGPPADAGHRTLWQARIAAALGEYQRVAPLLDLARHRGAARPGWSHTAPEWRFLPDRGILDRWLSVS